MIYNISLWLNFYLHSYSYLLSSTLVLFFLGVFFLFFENIKEIIIDYMYDINMYNKFFSLLFVLIFFIMITILSFDVVT